MAKNRHAKSNKSLSGAVLIMVLTVMFVLLIMLLATLTVVSTAQNKYYTKYEENQAYYTARSALDLYTQNLLTDKYYIAQDDIGQKTYHYTHKKSDGTTETKMKPMKQGLALELELYKAKAQKSITYTNFGTMDFANITNTDAVFTAGTPEASYYTNDGSAAPDSLTYQIEFPKIDGVSGSGGSSTDYGRFVDVDESTGNQIATITVEVLEREFDMSPVYTEAQITAATTATTPSIADIKKAIADGDRSKDRMKLKVTSTVKFMGIQSTATLIYNTSDPVIIPGGKALTSFGGLELNNLTIVGGGATDKYNEPKNMGSVYDSIYASEGLYIQGGGTSLPLSKKQAFYVGGDLSWQNSTPITTYGGPFTDDERPVIYVGGKMGPKTNSDGSISTSLSGSFPADVDVVTHGIEMLTNTPSFSGNLYSIGDVVLSSAVTSFSVGNAYIKGNLKYFETSAVPTGNYYVDGDIYVRQSYVDTSVTPPKVISGNLTNIYYTGDVYYYPSDSTVNAPVMADDPADKNSFSCSFNWNLVDLDSTELASDEEVEIVLPKFSGGSLVSGAKHKVPTYFSIYDDYIKRDSTGNRLKEDPTDPDSEYAKISAEEWAGTPDEEDRKAGNYTTKDLAPTGLKELKMRGNGWGMNVDGTDQGDYELNCASSASYLLKSCGTDRNNGLGGNSGYLHISGGGIVDLYLEASGNYGGKIVVDDDTTLNIYAPQGNYKWYTEVYNKTIYDKYAANDTLIFGDAANALAAPKINFYIGGTEANPSTWDMGEASKCLICGYIYAPYATVKANQGPKNMSWQYNNGATGTAQFFAIGSVISSKIDCGSNTTGVAYIDPSKSSGTPGDPKFTWAPYLYTHD